LTLELGLLLLLALGALLLVELVITGICRQAAAIDFNNFGDDAVS